MSSSLTVRKLLSLAERFDVLQRLDKKESQVSIAKHYGVHPSQISRIHSNKETILQDWKNNSNPDRKRRRMGKAKDVELELLRWFTEARRQQLPISGPLLKNKAAQLAEVLGTQDFKATSGWLERWKSRNGIKLKRGHGEKQETDDFEGESWVVDVLPTPVNNSDVDIDDNTTIKVEIIEDENIVDVSTTSGPSSKTVNFPDVLESLQILRRYLEMNGCQDYEQFYGLTSQLHRLHRQNRTQKRITDYFNKA